MLDSKSDTLPEPAVEAKKHSVLLKQCIQQACDDAGGCINFAQFLNIALYEPGLGYYSSGLQKFGSKGDFVTAPEISSLFGQCLANQISDVMQNIKKSNDDLAYIIEFGAGSGVLAVDILLALEQLGTLPEKYLILELSAELQHRQKKTLSAKAPHLVKHVQWLSRLPEGLNNVIVVANEVLDAMPVDCFKITNVDNNVNSAGIVKELVVDELVVALEGGQLISRYKPAEPFLVDKIKMVEQRSEIGFLDGYCSEINLSIKGWLAALENKIDNLVIFLIDYGYNEKEYYHPDRADGTLMCYYQHRAHEDFFWWPGLQDITAFVNFTDVAYCAVDLGLDVAGYSTQAAFLLASGLSELHESLVTDDVQLQIKLSQQIKTLTLPSEMGERFKVMALTKNYEQPLKGFSMQDLRNRL